MGDLHSVSLFCHLSAMIHVIGKFGPNLQSSTSYKLSEPFLQRSVTEINATLDSFKQSCQLNGCSLITNTWSNQKGRNLMNIVVHCPKKRIKKSRHPIPRALKLMKRRHHRLPSLRGPHQMIRKKNLRL